MAKIIPQIYFAAARESPIPFNHARVSLVITYRETNMRLSNSYRFLAFAFFLLTSCLLFVFGCSRPSFLVGIGADGKYMEAREEITRRRGGNVDKAIVNLEGVVREDPMYRDSLTLLGRAYYMKGRYGDAFQILQRAVAANPENEIAWLALGTTQLRLGEDEKGLKAVKGGLTLLSKASGGGYRGYVYWDRVGKVRAGLQRAVFVALKGTEEKDNLVTTVENVLKAVDEEEWYQQLESTKERKLLAD